ncbi:hypothetical protein HOP50_08g52230 [Chloropicon primus]|uniref:Uncharacterized protein n=1 Tax=Chloropicon primus TaxID=1764295 RepID=A0A5B8MSS2_9CHLO|nr:hypothetical protein A3770_08p51930 [Chloropicon primus]UPR01899.1 hypothetical protein HOP50_08g52230 [Chloropicon primus]|eukprot:QDZ22675.1 hypothetical protein A3770_08p51930 [Chloropicon primus]
MPKIVGRHEVVADAPEFQITELAGNVASKDDRISIARVVIHGPGSEPWLTLHYDEWICMLEGRMVLHSSDGGKVEVGAGDTVLVEKGERFKPEFLEAGSYVPVCLPAFSPDRCIREDEDEAGEAISRKLKELHKAEVEERPEVLFHMTEKKLWEKCVETGEAYYPPTFEEDGFYTHATGVPSRLIETANHFYQESVDSWVCLQFTRTSLRKAGIHVRDEEAMPVGDTQVGESWTNWICPHVVGGIPVAVVEEVHSMTREGQTFVSIEGITD